MSKEEKLNRVINLLETKNESLELIKKKKKHYSNEKRKTE